MAIPMNMQYMMSQLSGFTRNTIRIEPQASNSLSSKGNALISCVLPTNAVVNMKSFTCRALCKSFGVPAASGAAESEVYSLLPAGGIAAAVERISWAAGGLALDSSPSSYSVINRMKQNCETGIATFMSDQRVLGQSCIEPIDMSKVGNDSQGKPLETQENKYQGQEKHLAQTQWWGFSEVAPECLSTSILPELRFTMQLNSGAGWLPCQFRGTELGDRTPKVANANYTAGAEGYFTMTDVYFTIEVMSVQGNLLQEMVQRRLAEAGSIRLPYKGYTVFSSSNDGPGGSCRGSISTQSLNRVYGFQLSGEASPSGYTGPAQLASTKYQPPIPCRGSPSLSHIQCAHNFTSAGVSSSKVKILNSPFFLFTADPYDNFVALLNAQSRTYAKNSGGLIGSQDQWRENAWVNLVQLSHTPDNVRLMSGLDLSSVNGSVSFDVVGATAGDNKWKRTFMMILESSSTLVVGPQRAVALTV